MERKTNNSDWEILYTDASWETRYQHTSVLYVWMDFYITIDSGGNICQICLQKAWLQLNGKFHMMPHQAPTVYNILDTTEMNLTMTTMSTHTLEYLVNFKFSNLIS